MREYLQWFFREFDYPAGAAEVLIAAYDAFCANPEARQRLEDNIALYEKNKDCDLEGMLPAMADLPEKVGVHRYTAAFLLFACLSRPAKQHYLDSGLGEEFWRSGMMDLKWKLLECWDIFGIWGSFVAGWFCRFFHITCFSLGRMQFELKSCPADYRKGDEFVPKGSPVINVHIPRTGQRLDRTSQLASYQMAADFFRQRFGLEKAVFVCGSWLLYPKNLEVLSPGSNLHQFVSDYDIVHSQAYDTYDEVWRLFDTWYTGDVDALPQNTSLRRAYADWIRKGIKIGEGHGIMIWN